MLTFIASVMLSSHGSVIVAAKDGVWLVDRGNDQVLFLKGGVFAARPVDAWPQALALDFAGRPVVTCREAGTLMRLEPDGGVDRLSLPGGPGPLTITPDGRRGVVGLRDGNTVALVDLETWAVTQEVTLPGAPVDVVLGEASVYALLGPGGALHRFALDGGDGGVVEVLAPAPRRRGVQLVNAPPFVVALTRSTPDDERSRGRDPVEDRAFSVMGGRITGTWKYWNRVVPGGVSVGAHRSVIAFEDGTIAEQFGLGPYTGRDTRDWWRLEGFVQRGEEWLAFSPIDRALISLRGEDVDHPSTNPGWVKVTGRVPLPPGSRPSALLRGERLFTMESVATSSRGFSCEACHPDGRTDGLRWRLRGRALVPTRTTRGTERDDAWLQKHAVALGGSGFTTEDAQALMLYLHDGLREAR